MSESPAPHGFNVFILPPANRLVSRAHTPSLPQLLPRLSQHPLLVLVRLHLAAQLRLLNLESGDARVVLRQLPYDRAGLDAGNPGVERGRIYLQRRQLLG